MAVEIKFWYIQQFLFLSDKCSPEGIYVCKNGGMCNFDEANDNIKCLCPYSYGGDYCEKGIDLSSNVVYIYFNQHIHYIELLLLKYLR